MSLASIAAVAFIGTVFWVASPEAATALAGAQHRWSPLAIGLAAAGGQSVALVGLYFFGGQLRRHWRWFDRQCAARPLPLPPRQHPALRDRRRRDSGPPRFPPGLRHRHAALGRGATPAPAAPSHAAPAPGAVHRPRLGRGAFRVAAPLVALGGALVIDRPVEGQMSTDEPEPPLRARRPAATVRRLLRADDGLARIDHRIGLAAGRAQRGGAGRPGVGPVVDPRGGNAVAARPGVRGARRDLSGGRRSREVPVLLARPNRRVHGGMGVVAAGRVHRAPRGAGGDHLRQQRRLGQSALQHDPQGRRETPAC